MVGQFVPSRCVVQVVNVGVVRCNVINVTLLDLIGADRSFYNVMFPFGVATFALFGGLIGMAYFGWMYRFGPLICAAAIPGVTCDRQDYHEPLLFLRRLSDNIGVNRATRVSYFSIVVNEDGANFDLAQLMERFSVGIHRGRGAVNAGCTNYARVVPDLNYHDLIGRG